MRRHVLAAAVAAAALVPSLAMAQETCEQRSANRAAGTAIGAVAGALLGSAVAGHHEKGTGAVVGGIGGAIVGNQLARGPRDCGHAYGWYDNEGRWHANAVDRAVATGYYDRNGEWVDGQPRDFDDRRGGPAPDRPDAYREPPPYDIGFTEFRGVEDHIRRGIEDGVRADRLERRDAADFRDQLRRIQEREARDKAEIRAQLDQLDRQLDRTRREP
jgi:Glycine zipper 2TM domain